MKKLNKKQKMKILFVFCLVLSGSALHAWSHNGPLTVYSYSSSILIHILVPMFLGWTIIAKKIVLK